MDIPEASFAVLFDDLLIDRTQIQDGWRLRDRGLGMVRTTKRRRFSPSAIRRVVRERAIDQSSRHQEAGRQQKHAP